MTNNELIAEIAKKAGPEWMRRLDMRVALDVARPIIERETRRVTMEEAANIVRTQPCLGSEQHNRAALIAIFEAEASE